jgi:hypothetical protein
MVVVRHSHHHDRNHGNEDSHTGEDYSECEDHERLAIRVWGVSRLPPSVTRYPGEGCRNGYARNSDGVISSKHSSQVGLTCPDAGPTPGLLPSDPGGEQPPAHPDCSTKHALSTRYHFGLLGSDCRSCSGPGDVDEGARLEEAQPCRRAPCVGASYPGVRPGVLRPRAPRQYSLRRGAAARRSASAEGGTASARSILTQ